MLRLPDSHKGENGSVAIIGGSLHMHGAPLMSALAAEAAGADLVYVALPRCHWETAKNHSLNFQVHPFVGNELAEEDISSLLWMLATVDCAVIGPGILRTESVLQVLRQLVESAPCPLVLDASALQPWSLQAVQGKHAVLTPHLGELERMGLGMEGAMEAAIAHRCTLHVKGRVDKVFAPDGSMQEVAGGTAGLTVGGTGDVLAGLVASLRAQGMPATDACIRASRAVKTAGEMLQKTYGYAYTARRVIEMLPQTLLITA